MIKILPMLSVFFLIFSIAAADACTRSKVDGEAKLLPTNGKFNAALLDLTILAETNFQRCRNGRSELGSATGLRGPAKDHSEWMAKKNKLTHTSTQRGLKTMRDRINASKVPARYAAENLALLPLFDLTSRFTIIDRKKCKFASAQGKPLNPHSYQSFAQSVVSIWMNSPGHRRNILDRSQSVMGAAGAFRYDSKTCGSVYVTQLFVGR